MRHRDTLSQTLLAFFIPLYLQYWLYVTAKEMEQAYAQKAPPVWLLVTATILSMTGLIMIFTGSFISGASSVNGSEAGAVTGSLIMLFAFLVLITSSVFLLIYYYRFSGNAEKILGPQTSQTLFFILFWFVNPAAVYIIQDRLNTLGASPQAWQSPAVPQQPTAPPQSQGPAPQA